MREYGELPGERLDRSLARLRHTFRSLGERNAVVPRHGGAATAPAAPVDRNAVETLHHSGLLRHMFARIFKQWLPWQR